MRKTESCAKCGNTEISKTFHHPTKHSIGKHSVEMVCGSCFLDYALHYSDNDIKYIASDKHGRTECGETEFDFLKL